MRVYTICTQSYLAYAAVLAESLAETHPGQRLSVVLIDGDESSVLPFADVIVPSQLPLGGETEFHRMATIYDVVELATALKPWVFEHLFALSSEPVVYLDPDIQVFASLEDIGALAAHHGIVLNPHTLQPLPRDGRSPSERDLLLSGTYNLGFLALGVSAGTFVEWWAQRLRRDCINAVEEGYFVDQRWIDLVPSYFPHFVLRDPGYNVAYWNLPNRRVERVNGSYLVDGSPLRFFHFSGFSAATPRLLSKHQLGEPRVKLTEHPAVAELCRDYARRLRRHGHSRYARVRYRYDTAANGMYLTRAVRRAYRRELLRQEGEGREPSMPDPFTPRGAEQLVEFLREPVADETPLVSRYLQQVHRESEGLQAAFPDLRGRDAERFATWVIQGGEVGEDVPEQLMPGPRREQLQRGVNLYGYVFAESGTGQIGRSIVAALEAARIPHAVIPFVETINRQEHPFRSGAIDAAIYDTNLICVNADQVPLFIDKMGADLLRRRTNIGVWAWEVDDMPASMARNGDYLDEVWAISAHAAAGIQKRVRVPVRAFSLPVVAPQPVARSRHELGLSEGFLALFCFDFESVFTRKNPLAVIGAFRMAFPKNGEAFLCIKSVNGDRHRAELDALRAAAKGRDDITILDGYRPAAEQMALMNACDVYVSLHRAEGFGLTVAEAMSLGKPVISTAYSATMEFTTRANSYLVPAHVVAIPQGTPVYPSTAQWAEPDVAAAAAMLRHVYDNPEEARAMGDRACRDIQENHGPEARAAALGELLETSEKVRASRPPRPRMTMPSTGVLAADERAASLMVSPRADLPSRFPRLAGWWRRLILRLIRNYWVQQREVDRALLDAVRSSRESVRLELQALTEAVSERLERLEQRVEDLERPK